MSDAKLPKPVDFDQLYPGRFLKSGEFLGKKFTLTITDVELEELEDDKKGTKVRGIISFKETPKQLCLNRTNGEYLKAMFGRNIQEWRGKRVTLWPTTTTFGRERDKPCIRIWGSPDIARDLEVTIKLPKKGATIETMHKVGGDGRNEPQQKPAANEPPEPGSNG